MKMAEAADTAIKDVPTLNILICYLLYKINKPVDDFNHLLDAMRYALEDFVKGDVFSFD